MKKSLIVGAAGFVGDYLIDYIQRKEKWSLAVTKMPHETIQHTNINIYDLNILDSAAINEVLNKEQPDYIFHLAAQSSVAQSWKNPELTIDVNIKGTLNLLNAVKDMDKSPRLLLIGSGEEYGHVNTDEIPIHEDNCLRPGNLYAASKACQNMIGKIYSDAYDMDVMSVRAFNHMGPNQAPIFVVADFCKQVAEIEKGYQEPVIRVGNLSARRDFTDVRDVVRSYVMLMEQGRKGQTYNVGSGNAISIQSILDKILSLSSIPIKVEIDPSKLRPVDIPVIEADIRKLTKCTGWSAEIPLSQTLKETLDYWRQNH